MGCLADRWWRVLCAGLLLVAELPPPAYGRTPAGFRVTLGASTVQAFQRYVAATEAQNNNNLGGGKFLWVDALPEKERRVAYQELQGGEIEMRRVPPPATGANAEIPGGMVHDWSGIVFIPGVKLEQVLGVLQDYDRHATIYAPDVERAKMEQRDGNHYLVFLRFRRTKMVTVVLDTEHEVNYYRDSSTRAHSRSSAIRIAEVENPGTPNEKEKKPGEDQGFMWRMETWWSMEEKNGGVYVQNQVVSLTRDVPTGLGWLIEPYITSIPKESLAFSLKVTRKAVLAREKTNAPLASISSCQSADRREPAGATDCGQRRASEGPPGGWDSSALPTPQQIISRDAVSSAPAVAPPRNSTPSAAPPAGSSPDP
jgi:hypothetical protein